MSFDTPTLFDQLNEAAAYLRERTDFKPRTGLILGTGLGGLIDQLDLHMKWDYEAVPHFPVSTVEGHAGSLLMGHLAGEPVIVLNGRFHYYEGYSAKELTFPTRLLCHLGIERLLISNVSGSTNRQYRAADVVIVKDHINMHPDNPLRGKNDERLGLRFPDLLNAYDPALRKLASSAMDELKLPAHQGVYVGLQGPNLETPAEYRMIKIIGGDLVGMSTVQEVLVANHMSVPVLVTSLVSNECHDPDNLTETTLEEVLEVAHVGGRKMQQLWKAILSTFASA
ncbi:MAG: purine-nucleoside phosphorylase [Saprospiraceae bacterium]